MTEREKIAARIRALLAKTVANGCTEDEAISAAAKVAEMLARYNLTVDEVELRASPFSKHSEHHDDPVGDRLWKVSKAVAELTETRFWTSPAGVRPVGITFFGFDHEVAIAKYMLAICANAMRSQADLLRQRLVLLRPSISRSRQGAFLDGMADSLARRLLELKPPKPTGTGLMVVKDQLIEAALKDDGVELKDRNRARSRDLDAIYQRGVRAGDAVNLNTALDGETRRKILLR